MTPRVARWLIAGTVLVSCAGPYREPGEGSGDGAAERSSTEDAEPDYTVVGTIEPDGTLTADTLVGEVADTSSVERETVYTGPVRQPESTQQTLATGYRVQVFAARDQSAVEEVVDRLEKSAPGHPIYVEWVDPWYKVRVGDFANRDDAEALKRELVDLGFPDAWAVQTTIRTVP